MADEALEPTEELELTEEVQPDTPETDEEEILTFGDAPEEVIETDNAVIRHLRERLKETNKKLAEVSKPKAEEPTTEDLGPEPELEHFDYDEGRFRVAVREYERKALQIEARKGKSSETQQAELEATRQRIAAEKQALNRPDIEDAFELVRTALTDEQQSALVRGTEKGGMTAKMIYALAKSPGTLASLASTDNLFDFAVELGTLRKELIVVKRRKTPEPDVPEKGSGTINAPTDKKLKKLEEEAEATGDRTALFAYRRELRRSGKL